MADTHHDVAQLDRERSASGRSNGLATVSDLSDVEGGHKAQGQGAPPLQRNRTITDRLHADFLFNTAQNSRVTFASSDPDVVTVDIAWMVPHSLFRFRTRALPLA